VCQDYFGKYEKNPFVDTLLNAVIAYREIPPNPIPRFKRILLMGSHLGFLAKAVSSLVHIHSQIPEEHPSTTILGTERSGSGVIIESGGYILTVGYVVMGAKDVQVVCGDGERLEARISHQDFESGLAVIQALGLEADPIPAKPASELEVGMPVALLASNGEEEVRGSQGIITDLGPFDAQWEYMLDSAVKSTAMNPGLGGGALLTMDGSFRGTISLNINLIGTCSLSIPVDLFLARRDIFVGKQGGETNTSRPWLGVFPQPLERGVLVAGLVPGGPAEQSGIETGDVVLYVNGAEVSSRRAFYERLWQGKAGDVVKLTIFREKSIETILVPTKSRAEFYR
jgi:S1-C subfamily serine protease